MAQYNEWWYSSGAANNQGGGGDPGDPIGHSLRFREGATPQLNRDGFTSPSTYTISYWFKRGSLTKEQQFIWWWNPNGMGQGFAPTANMDEIWNNTSPGAVSLQKYRDPSAWYHLVINTGTDNWWLNGERIAGDASGGMGTVSQSRSTATKWKSARYPSKEYFEYP